MAPSPVIERNARRLIALRTTARRGGEVERELAPIIADLRDEIDPTLPKRVAARLLGVSVPTLNKWVARGLIPVERKGRYQRVRRDPLLELAEQVAVVRSTGQTGGVVAEAVHQLQAKDPTYQREAAELYGESLAAIGRGDLVAAAIPAGFGPDD
jgi:excisionase family DNA binding protein